tara:strand:+ start:5346 stop:5612 length:267 start_codon:yes stop_codon:yes gene_type:complete
MSLRYGEPIEAHGGYARLAAAVVVRAARDVHGKGGDSDRHRAHLRKTARAFLSDPFNESLGLWCAWLKMDPMRMQEAYASILDRDLEL